MTKLTMWNDLPQSTHEEITHQILSSNNTKIIDLGDVIGHLKSNMPADDFLKMWDGVEILFAVLTESFNTKQCEVKMIISEAKK